MSLVSNEILGDDLSDISPDKEKLSKEKTVAENIDQIFSTPLKSKPLKQLKLETSDSLPESSPEKSISSLHSPWFNRHFQNLEFSLKQNFDTKRVQTELSRQNESETYNFFNDLDKFTIKLSMVEEAEMQKGKLLNILTSGSKSLKNSKSEISPEGSQQSPIINKNNRNSNDDDNNNNRNNNNNQENYNQENDNNSNSKRISLQNIDENIDNIE